MCSVPWGNIIFSYLSTVGGYNDTCGGYHECCGVGGVQYCGGTQITKYDIPHLAFFLEFFSGGEKSIVMQISSVMLLFSDQNSGRGKSFQGGKLPQGVPPCGRKPATVLNTPKALMISPTCIMTSPHGTEYPSRYSVYQARTQDIPKHLS